MKNFLKQNWYWIGIVIVLVSLLISKCHNEKLTKKDTVEYKTVSSKIEAVELAQLPETIVKKFTKIKTVTKFVDRIKIDTIQIHYKDSIPCDFNRSGELKTKEYSFTYQSNNKGLNLSNFNIEDSLIVVTGTKRKWIFGKETNTVDISHSNKYISSDNVLHIEVKPKKAFYDTTLFKFGAGFILGVVIVK